MNRACIFKNTIKHKRLPERSELNLHEQKQHASLLSVSPSGFIRSVKSNFNQVKKGVSKSVSMFTLVPMSVHTAANNWLSYLIGAVIALLIMGYLVYSLLRPDKF